MRYHKPFTPKQRRDAARVYRSLSSNYRSLRKVYPPANRTERAVLGAYQDYVRATGSELLKVNALVNVDELNRLIQLAANAMAEYFRLRHFSQRGDDE